MCRALRVGCCLFLFVSCDVRVCLVCCVMCVVRCVSCVVCCVVYVVLRVACLTFCLSLYSSLCDVRWLFHVVS